MTIPTFFITSVASRSRLPHSRLASHGDTKAYPLSMESKAGNRGKSPGNYSARVAIAGRHARAGGHPWRQKTQVLHGVGMGSRLRGNDAAVLPLTLHLQQTEPLPGVLILLRKRALSFCFAVRLHRKTASYFSGRTLGRACRLKAGSHGICGNAGFWRWQARSCIEGAAARQPEGTRVSPGARAHRTVIALKAMLPLTAALIVSLYALPSFLQSPSTTGAGRSRRAPLPSRRARSR